MNRDKLRICLLSMPLSVWSTPSIGLAQLSAIVRKNYPDQVTVKTVYANLDFIDFIGLETYKNIESRGFGELMFRNVAFSEPRRGDYKETYPANTMVSNDPIIRLTIEKERYMEDFLNSVIDKFELDTYAVCGFTSMLLQNVASFAMARLIKSRNPDCCVVMGGTNCDYPMGKTIIDNVASIDYVFSGPAIVSFSKFVSCLLNNDLERTHIIDGVFSKNNELIGSSNVDAKYIVDVMGKYHDMESCIDIEYDDFFEQYDRFVSKNGIKPFPSIPFETSRGCWKRDKQPCCFCGLNSPRAKYASMKPKVAIEYINRLIRKYSSRSSFFISVDTMLSKEYITEVLPKLIVPPGVMLFYEVSATMNDDELVACAHANLEFMLVGIESLHSQTLRLMHKGVTALNNIRFLRSCIEIGIYPSWNILIALPNEVNDDMYTKLLNDLPYLKHLPPPDSLTPIYLCRFSHYVEHAEMYGIKLGYPSSLALLYPFSKESLINLCNVFIDVREDAAYQRNSRTFNKILSPFVTEWIAAFNHHKTFPTLQFIDTYRILDSRFDITHPRTLTLTILQREVLNVFRSSHVYSDLLDMFPEKDDSELKNAFDYLMQNNLLFEECGIFISLVCEASKWRKDKYIFTNQIKAQLTDSSV